MPMAPARAPVPTVQLLRSAWLLIAALACGGSADPVPVRFDEAGQAVLPQEEGTKRITPGQVAWLREQGVAFLFVDSRSREAHREGRPAGSVSLPLEMTELAATRLPADRLIVTFCT